MEFPALEWLINRMDTYSTDNNLKISPSPTQRFWRHI